MTRPSKGHIPMRTCIYCGARRAKNDLIRLGLDKDERVRMDDRQAMPGRGAYVCKNDTCLGAVSDKRRLERAFRSKVTID